MPFISKRVIDKFCLSRKALNGGKDDAVKRVKLGRRSGYFDDFDVIDRIRRKSSMCGRRTGTLVCAASRAHRSRSQQLEMVWLKSTRLDSRRSSSCRRSFMAGSTTNCSPISAHGREDTLGREEIACSICS